jgi:hypothetical protein
MKNIPPRAGRRDNSANFSLMEIASYLLEMFVVNSIQM